MGVESLASRIDQSEAHATELLRLHRRLYADYWRWSDGAVHHALLRGYLHTVFGWHIRPGTNVNPRSLANFPVQANGAEMMRLSAIGITEANIEAGAPAHDAFLIHAPCERIDEAVAVTRNVMTEASRVVLGGFGLRTDFKIVRHPDRYMDKRGVEMWTRLTRLARAFHGKR
jgi:hypothetical protein